MRDSGNKGDQNVVDLAAARKKQRTIQAKGGRHAHGASANDPFKRRHQSTKPALSKKLVGVVQLVLFMGALFYFLQLCRGPS